MKIEYRKITKNRILFLLVVFPYLSPYYISGVVDYLYNIGKILSFLICTYMIITDRESRQRCKFINYIGIFYSIYLVSTVINHGNINRACIDGISVIGFCLTICVFGFGKDRRLFYQVLVDVYTLLLIINIFSILRFSEGISVKDFYFLGHDDMTVFWLLPYIVFSYLYDSLNTIKTIKAFHVSIFIAVISLLLTLSVSGIVAMLTFAIAYLILGKNIRMLKAFNIIIILSNVGLVVFKIQYWFSFIIENIMHRSIGLTGRDKIWDRALYWVMRRPILGYGCESNNVLMPKFTLADGSYFQFAHCHNYLLQVLYTEGIIGICFFVILYFFVWKKMFAMGLNKHNRMIASLIISIMCALLVNSYQQPIALFTLFILGYEMEYILKVS